MVDDSLDDRTGALFGRQYTLRVASTIARLSGTFARKELVDSLALGREADSAIDRELASLVDAGLLEHEKRGPYVRRDSSYWVLATSLLDEWSTSQSNVRPLRVAKQDEPEL